MPEEKTDAQIRDDKTKAALTNPQNAYNDKMIAALLRERAGLEQQGKTDRLSQVDDQLAAYGHTPPGAKADASSSDGASDGRAARKQQPQGRSTKPQQTGD